MAIPRATCDPSKLEAVLAETASAEEECWVQEHLDSCLACRQRMYQSAASEESWHSAERFLPDEHLDDELLSSDRGAAAHDGRVAVGDNDIGIHDIALNDDVQRVLDTLAPTDDPRMTGRLGSYEILGLIGSGGMGVVLKGFDASLNRYVAIKVLPPRLACNGAARRRFAREAQAAAAVVHPHVIGIHFVSADSTLPFFVMPYVRGMSLQKRLDQRGPLAVAEILRIAGQAAAGLAAAHAQGLVHRDIKPANILLEEGVERVTITDFGLARTIDDAATTHSGMVAGTPQYMSPEQARGETLDHRSDLFSLGSVIYAMCTGHSPFRAESFYAVLRRIADDVPRPVREVNGEIPLWLEMVIEKLLAKDPSHRYQTADELARVLEQCLAHSQNPTLHPLPAELRVERGSRSRTGALVVLACSVVLLGVLVVTGIFRLMNDDALPLPSSPAGGQAGNTPGGSRADWGDEDAAALDELRDKGNSLEQESRSLWNK